MVVFQITLDIFLRANLPADQAMGVICKFIDGALCQRDELVEFHKARKYKNYCFNSLYPVSEDKIYHRNRRYQLQIRTTDMDLAEHFANEMADVEDRILKVMDASVKLMPKKPIQKLYSITPCILKSKEGYWREHMSEKEFCQAIKNNLVKKYKKFTKQNLEEDFELLSDIKFINRKPILCAYKDFSLIGDKLDLFIGGHPVAQELAYFALGVGVLEGNARGFGFVNDKWKK